MKRLYALVLAALFTPALAAAQAEAQANGSADAKIRNAMSAAPQSIAASATILDWPATEGGEPVQLRAGTNGWTCFPDFPGSDGDDPQCLDRTWLNWASAYLKKEAPRIERVGIGYMIAPGGASTSNTDPYATAPSPDNDWGHDPPHLMVLVPDLEDLEGLPTTRESGGPWVMWRGTPYAHIMVPLESVKK